ncbi:SIR2 family protein [Photobacterium damselae]|uniref:SIR2 family protein n=1 Tax=Photobacterium damselae TaxID=38293 RepID=UPI00406934EA
MAFEPKPHKHLIHILKTTSNPNFTLFLGAGASVTSGVSHAGELIKQWRAAYSNMYPQKNIEEEYWYDKPTEYSELFETLYDQPSQRREFIESCIKDAIPSWGYIYLSNLLKNNVFNTVFTTNFDDLINEACYSFSTDLKPLVSAHDSSISSVRLTSPRPKIIKLHGDFLFDNIKNTVRELESLEDNMRAKFRQYASEFGMIVIGYAGNDRSIMETLNTLLRHDSNFPHGIYWCVMKGTVQSDLAKELEELTRFPRFHIIEIDGFDEFLADIHHELGLEIQAEVSEPYKHLANRLDSFVKRNGTNDNGEHEHPSINKDIQKLKDHLTKVHSAIGMFETIEKIIENSGLKGVPEASDMHQLIEELASEIKPLVNKNTEEIHLISTPNALLAEFAANDKNYKDAYKLSKAALENRITIESISTFMRALLNLGKLDEFGEITSMLESIKSLSDRQAQRLISVAVELMEKKEHIGKAEYLLNFVKSKPHSEEVDTYVDLNLALIDRLQGQEVSEDLVDSLNNHLKNTIDSNDHWLTFGVSLILNNEDVVMEAAAAMSQDDLTHILIQEMPISSLISQELYDKLSLLVETEEELPDSPSESCDLLDSTDTNCSVENITVSDASNDSETGKKVASTTVTLIDKGV